MKYQIIKDVAKTSINLILLLCLIACTNDSKKLPEKPKFGKQEAYIHAQMAIEKQLKSPGSAHFNIDYENDVAKYNDTTFIVTSFVDSQNGFGAQLRADFSCIITYSPKTDMVNTKILELKSR